MADRRRRNQGAGDPLRLRIDRSSPAPPYAQLVEQIHAAIDSGSLAAGDRLPTIRALAERTGLVPNTVAKAYRELEAEGAVEGRGRAGTFVRGDGLEDAARAYLERARRLGADPGAAVEAVRRAAP